MPTRYEWRGMSFNAVWNNAPVYPTNATTTPAAPSDVYAVQYDYRHAGMAFAITRETVERRIEALIDEAIRQHPEAGAPPSRRRLAAQMYADTEPEDL